MLWLSVEFPSSKLCIEMKVSFLILIVWFWNKQPLFLVAPPSTMVINHLFMCRPSEKSKEKKETAEQETFMKGPGTFPLERLLAIFQCITSVADGSVDEEEEGNDGLGVQCGDNSLMSGVLFQLSSLCNANFIVKGGSCPLEGSTRYRSTVSEDMALKVNFIL